MGNQSFAELAQKLNSRDSSDRLAALKEVKVPVREKFSGITNNHVHSGYSFSPYMPARIVLEAYRNDLDVVGIMDHDAIGGAEEFIKAGKEFGIATTVGFEVRTDWSDTPFKDRRLNNPDQIGCAYMCVHGIPHQKIADTAAFLNNIVTARNVRNRAMVAKINALVPDTPISFDKDVVPLSLLEAGGSITERHILFALSNKMIEKQGKGETLIKYLSDVLRVSLSAGQQNTLLDTTYEYYAYDVLNILKSAFVAKIFIPAEPPETPSIKDLIAFCNSIGAIAAYAYLGDVTESPTGDKKAQVFEDAYLDELFAYLETLGVPAVAYMPSRNTAAQMARVMTLCEKHGLFQISGEDINQPRQSFICKQLKEPAFLHLVESAWALVGHEKKASMDIQDGMFANQQKKVPLDERIKIYAAFGREGSEQNE